VVEDGLLTRFKFKGKTISIIEASADWQKLLATLQWFEQLDVVAALPHRDAASINRQRCSRPLLAPR
jgi:hypothetical protein